MLWAMIAEHLPNPDCSVHQVPASTPHVDDSCAGLVPLVVGVTGHRDIREQDKATVLEHVNRVLAAFEKRWPHSPKILICGLAEGADQWACECALNRSWSVVAGLAAPAESFIRDFSSDEIRTQFESLRARCLSVQVVCPDDTPSPTRYEKVGEWICRQSQWLIALWDGQAATESKPGGAAWVVQRFLNGEIGPDLQTPDSGPVTQITVQRATASEKSPVEEATITTRELWPEASGSSTREHWLDILQRIDEFNGLARQAVKTPGAPEAIARARAELWKSGSVLPCEDGLRPVMQQAVALYGVADHLANQAAGSEKWRLQGIVSFAVLASVLVELYSGPLDSDTVGALSGSLLTGGLAALLIAMLITWWPRLRGQRHSLRFNAEARREDCRGLAEACRVQTYWAYAGLDVSVADHYLPDQRDQLEWLRQALRNLMLIRGEGAQTHGDRGSATQPQRIGIDAPSDADRIRSVLVSWVRSQRSWHEGSQKAQGRKSLQLQATVQVALVIGLIAVIGAVVAEFLTHPLAQSPVQPAWLQFTWGVALSIAAAAGTVRVVRGYRENVRNYARMSLTERLAELELERLLNQTPPDIDACRQVLFALGRAALDENGEWLLMHRDRPAGPPL